MRTAICALPDISVIPTCHEKSVIVHSTVSGTSSEGAWNSTKTKHAAYEKDSQCQVYITVLVVLRPSRQRVRMDIYDASVTLQTAHTEVTTRGRLSVGTVAELPYTLNPLSFASNIVGVTTCTVIASLKGLLSIRKRFHRLAETVGKSNDGNLPPSSMEQSDCPRLSLAKCVRVWLCHQNTSLLFTHHSRRSSESQSPLAYSLVMPGTADVSQSVGSCGVIPVDSGSSCGRW